MVWIRLRKEEVAPRYVEDAERPKVLRPLSLERVVGAPDGKAHRSLDLRGLNLEGDVCGLLGELG